MKHRLSQEEEWEAMPGVWPDTVAELSRAGTLVSVHEKSWAPGALDLVISEKNEKISKWFGCGEMTEDAAVTQATQKMNFFPGHDSAIKGDRDIRWRL